MDVTDNDTLTLTVSLNRSSFAENAGSSAATGTVTRNAENLGAALTVTLTSGDTTEATVPATITIPAGQASATFTIAAIDDAVVDGTQNVTFTAAATSYTAGTATLGVTDNDVLTLTLSLNKSSIAENSGANAATGTVTRNSADLSSALTVTLTSSDTTEATALHRSRFRLDRRLRPSPSMPSTMRLLTGARMSTSPRLPPALRPEPRHLMSPMMMHSH